MKTRVRYVVAYLAGYLSGNESVSVYDHSQARHCSMGGGCDANSVSIYDEREACHITGTGNKGTFQLYHHGEKAHVTLELLGTKFNGYDHASGTDFNGTVNARNVMLYDSQMATHYSYFV